MSRNLPLDDNRNPITNFDNGIIVSKTVNLSGAGATISSPFTIFTVTGSSLARVWGVCTTDLAGANAKISVGLIGVANTALLIADTTATNIDSGEIWRSATPDAGLVAYTVGNIPQRLLADGLDITYTTSVVDVSSGVIDFYCLYVPISDDADIVPVE